MNTASPLPQPTATESTARASGWVFLAVDGCTGPVWDELTTDAAREAHLMVEAHLAAACPVDDVHRVCGTVPEVPVVCRTRVGEEFMVFTSPTGLVEFYARAEAGAAPQVLRGFVDGEVTAALYDRLVDLFGVPTSEDSNASA